MTRARLRIAASLVLLSCGEAPPLPLTELANPPLGLTTSSGDVEWLAHGGDPANRKFSALAEIDRANVHELEIAWRWHSIDDATRETDAYLNQTMFEATPLMLGGTLFLTTAFTRAVALDATTGEQRWLYDPQSHLFPTRVPIGIHSRGVASWSSGGDRRIVFGTSDGFLVALDAHTGALVPAFGTGGRVDLTLELRRPVDRRFYSLTSPPAVCGDVIVVGSWVPDMPIVRNAGPGDVRGFDARSGELLWTFHTIPQAGEVGHDTWQADAAESVGNTNVWSLMSADEALGLVYLPVSMPSDNFYGGARLGDNLFSDSLVALDCKTGERRWHQQLIHHDVWDYDIASPPNLVELVIEGRPIAAVAQPTKAGFLFVFDRATGAPVWPIEERPVPASSLPGERVSATQPFPTRPPPFERQGVSDDDLIDFTPELRAEARRFVADYEIGPLYTPPSARGAIHLPGWSGGASWGGAAFDPATHTLYVPSITEPIALRMRPTGFRTWLKNVFGPAEDRIEADWEIDFVRGARLPNGLPLLKPPYGRITAYDLDRGEIRWQVANGTGPVDHPLLAELELPRLGTTGRSSVLIAGDLLFASEGASQKVQGGDPFFRAYAKATGELVWEVKLDSHAVGAPMTYRAAGRQFVVVATGGFGEKHELVAFALPVDR